MTTQQLLEYLYQHLAESMRQKGKENMDEIGRLCGAVSLIEEAAEYNEDWKLAAICDDFLYIQSHQNVSVEE